MSMQHDHLVESEKGVIVYAAVVYMCLSPSPSLSLSPHTHTHTHTHTGVEYGLKPAEICGKDIKIEIWDTAGQECYQALTRQYYR